MEYEDGGRILNNFSPTTTPSASTQTAIEYNYYIRFLVVAATTTTTYDIYKQCASR